jgi:hypothetical protein
VPSQRHLQFFSGDAVTETLLLVSHTTNELTS